LFSWECIDEAGDVEVESPGSAPSPNEPEIDLLKSSIREQANGDLIVGFETAGAIPSSAADMIWVVTAWLKDGSINTFDYSLIGSEATVQIGDWEGDQWVVPGELIRASGNLIELRVPSLDIPAPITAGEVESWSAGAESNHMYADPWYSFSDECSPGTVTASNPQEPATPESASTSQADDATEPGLVMPNLICVDLQKAQDDLQALTGKFFIDSYDSSGRNRFQINDSNWTVTEQTPDPGSEIVNEVSIGAIKDDEVASCG